MDFRVVWLLLRIMSAFPDQLSAWKIEDSAERISTHVSYILFIFSVCYFLCSRGVREERHEKVS